MRYRYVFIAGLAVGFVLGARAGRERYEQLERLARKTAGNPTVQQAAGTIQAQAAGLARTAKDRLADRVPPMAGSVRSKIGDTLHDRVPGMRGKTGNPEADGHRHYAPSPGGSHGRPDHQ